MMIQYLQLVKRNLLLYLRDKGTVFFSLLSMIVVLCLMIFFLGDINISMLTDKLALLPDRNVSEDEVNAFLLILAWTTGGIIPSNAVMVTLSSYSAMIKDRNCKRSDAIYTSPVSRTVIALSYITSTCLSAVIICSLTFIIAEIYFIIRGAAVLSVLSHIKVFSMIILSAFSYSAIMYLFATLVKTESAWSGFGTVIGALVGFFGGIYMPIGQLSPILQDVLKCTPIIYSTAMFRDVICGDIMGVLFEGVPTEISDIYAESMGIGISVLDTELPPIACCAVLFTAATLCFGAGMLVLNHRRRKGAK